MLLAIKCPFKTKWWWWRETIKKKTIPFHPIRKAFCSLFLYLQKRQPHFACTCSRLLPPLCPWYVITIKWVLSKAVLCCNKSLQPCSTLCDPWTIAWEAPLSIGFSRQEYRSGLLCTPPGNLLDPGIKHTSLTSPALAGLFFTTSTTWEALWVKLNLSNWRDRPLFCD